MEYPCIPKGIGDPSSKRYLGIVGSEERLVGPGSRRASIYRSWNDAVRAYSRCFLTFRSDPLLALSGLAKKFHENAQDEYIVGMWRSNLLGDLLWSVIHPEKWHYFASNSVYVAPTWSWASPPLPVNTGTMVNAEYETEVLDAEINNVEIGLVGGHRFGEVESGKLTIEGRIFSMDLRKHGVSKKR